jgi:SAM-dependent methyltransferase
MTVDVDGVFKSFRDPMGSVVIVGGRVFRFIHKPHEAAVHEFLAGDFFDRHSIAGDIPTTHVVTSSLGFLNEISNKYGSGLILEHQSIPFPIYPHEWTPAMLFDAGEFTLRLAEDALNNGLMLKDATPWNVLFSNGRPVFCDILSFEPWMERKIWNAYAQFQRTFTLPLYAHKRHAWPVHSIFIDKRDGLDPSLLISAIKGWRYWAPFELQTIILPSMLSRAFLIKGGRSESHSSITRNRRLADFVLRRSFYRLRKQLQAVRPHLNRNTQWSNYEDSLQHYTSEEHDAKSNFVRMSLLRAGSGRVLDIGSNAGEYSLMAAYQGNSVVSADFDVAALDKLYARAKLECLPITPVVFNIARPTPAIGWGNEEVSSFLVRAKGQFNVLMVLAVLHHLIVTERIPLEGIMKQLYDFGARFLIVEWVNPDDQRFKQISQTHGDLYCRLSVEAFEKVLEKNFSIMERLHLASKTRVLYLCERRGN